MFAVYQMLEKTDNFRSRKCEHARLALPAMEFEKDL